MYWKVRVPGLDRLDDVFILDLGDGENRFDRTTIASLLALVDQVEAAPPPRALVTVATGKFWSNGFDQTWMSAHPDEVDALLAEFRSLVGRLITLSAPAVAALQGHAFAAGAMLALAHDFRLIRDDRGYFCLPEIDLGMAISPASVALVQAKVPAATAEDLLLVGRRYGGADAVAAGIARATASEEGLRAAAVELAASMAGKDPATLGTMKRRMFAGVAALLAEEGAPGLSPAPPSRS
jgi:enoyl-CoA hydratase/carnithine racemase